MVTQPNAPVPQTARLAPRTPLRILRTETVLSRFPIHNLTTHGRISIHLRRTNAQGDLDYLWDVSTSAHRGPPEPLAYKLDTLVINRLLDALPRPVPRVLHVGSLRQVAPQLALNTSGRQQEHLKSAFHQNASAYIVTKLRYRDRDGRPRCLEAGFTRYSVVWQGDMLPDGTPADAVYLVLSEPYREILNHAPVRPLDYTYLQALTPMAQRFLLVLVMPETLASPAPTTEPAAPPPPQAEALVQQFYQRFHGRAQVTPTAKELTQATALLTAYGLEKAQYLLTFSYQAAQATQYDPQFFGGILHYLDRALAAYDAQAMRVTQAAAQRTAADERTWHERY